MHIREAVRIRDTRWQAAVWGVVLLVSAGPYLAEAALDHFLWHLVYGGSAGTLVGAGVSLYRGRQPQQPSLWALAGYSYMVVPDILWLVPLLWGDGVYPHQPWMDIFLGHVFLDHWAHTTVLLLPTMLVAAAVWTATRRYGEGRAQPA